MVQVGSTQIPQVMRSVFNVAIVLQLPTGKRTYEERYHTQRSCYPLCNVQQVSRSLLFLVGLYQPFLVPAWPELPPFIRNGSSANLKVH